MNKDNFTRYEELPEDMLNYLRHYGMHFNHKMCDFATDRMTVKIGNREEKLTPFTKEEVDRMLKTANVTLKNNQLYDYVYVANMCKADFYKSSVIDEIHVAYYIKDVIEDVDAPDGLIFNRWYSDMCYCGMAIDWEAML